MSESPERLKFKVAEEFSIPPFPEAPEYPSLLVTATLWGVLGWGGVLILSGVFGLDAYMLFAGSVIGVIAYYIRKFRNKHHAEKIGEWKRMIKFIWEGNSEFTKMRNMFVLSGVELAEAEQLASSAMVAWNAQENKFVSFMVNNKNNFGNEGVTLVHVYYEPKNFRKMRVNLEMTVPDFA